LDLQVLIYQEPTFKAGGKAEESESKSKVEQYRDCSSVILQEESTDGKNLSITISKKIASDKGIQLNQLKDLEKRTYHQKISKISNQLQLLPANSCNRNSCKDRSSSAGCRIKYLFQLEKFYRRDQELTNA
jgi:hypothetical protein